MWEKTTTLAALAVLGALALAALPGADPEPPPLTANSVTRAAHTIEGPRRLATGLPAPASQSAVSAARLAQVDRMRAAAREPLRVAIDPATQSLVEPALRSIGRGPDHADWAGGAVLDAFERVLDGRAEIAVAPREPSREERLRGLGELRIGELVVGLVVHESNPVTSIPSRRLRDLVRGSVTDWSELGGAPGAVRVLVPTAGPVADLYARTLVAGDRFQGADDTLADDRARVRAVASDPHAVAVVSITCAADFDVRLMSIDGEPPSLGASRCGRYPYSSPIVLGYKDANSLRVRAFLADLRGATARGVLAAAVCVD
ncbi:MAG: hypothetical protein HZB39_18280 [Planctomycetes bacterium]|nr:hypothetical protein [Planctomycetota bacterium]